MSAFAVILTSATHSDESSSEPSRDPYGAPSNAPFDAAHRMMENSLKAGDVITFKKAFTRKLGIVTEAPDFRDSNWTRKVVKVKCDRGFNIYQEISTKDIKLFRYQRGA